MNKNSMISSLSSFIMAVDLEESLTIINLIRAKKALAGVINDLSYDFNSNGVIDENDINSIRKSLLSVSALEQEHYGGDN